MNYPQPPQYPKQQEERDYKQEYFPERKTSNPDGKFTAGSQEHLDRFINDKLTPEYEKLWGCELGVPFAEKQLANKKGERSTIQAQLNEIKEKIAGKEYRSRSEGDKALEEVQKKLDEVNGRVDFLEKSLNLLPDQIEEANEAIERHYMMKEQFSKRVVK